MAPDPKEVRIDSHVEYNGDRCRVSYIAPMDKIYQFYLRRKDYPFDIHAHIFEVNPIPITPELLNEFGFDMSEDWNNHLRGSKRLDTLDGFVEFEELGPTFDNLWKMLVFVQNDKYRLSQCLFVRYLHEAEGFLYQTTKQELIND